MKKYDKEKSDAELAAAANKYHNDIVKDMHDEEVRACQVTTDSGENIILDEVNVKFILFIKFSRWVAKRYWRSSRSIQKET